MNSPTAAKITDSPQISSDAVAFAWQTHAYINEYIRFADAKALAVMAWATALIGGLFSVNAHRIVLDSKWLTDKCEWWHTIHCVAISAAFVVLAAAFVCGKCVLLPRLNRRPTPSKGEKKTSEGKPSQSKEQGSSGAIFWKDILSHGNACEFEAVVSRSTDEQRLKWLCEHEFVLSQIADTKYLWVTRAIQIGAVGSLVACLAGAGLIAKG